MFHFPFVHCTTLEVTQACCRAHIVLPEIMLAALFMCLCVLQAVKFEPYHDSALVRFLLKRALRVSRHVSVCFVSSQLCVCVCFTRTITAVKKCQVKQHLLFFFCRVSVSVIFSSGSCGVRSLSPSTTSRGTLSSWRPTSEAVVKICCRTSGSR